MTIQNPLATMFGDFLSRHLDVHKPRDVLLWADKILERIGEKKNNYGMKLLGYGGKARVFWMSDKKKVLKVTRDVTDAQASEVVRKKPSKDLVKVYDVFDLYPQDLYCIVAEKLTPLAGVENKKWGDIAKIVTESNDIYDLPHWSGLTDVWVEWTKEALPAIEEQRGAEFAANFKAYLHQLEVWEEALYKNRKIIWSDLIADNIMHRGRTLVISDLGRSKVASHPSIPSLKW